MANFLYRIGYFAGRRPWRVLGIWVLLAASAFALNGAFGGEPDESFSIPGAESQRAADAIEDRFPRRRSTRRTLSSIPTKDLRSGDEGG